MDAMKKAWAEVKVSLFTREWIEIPTATVTETDAGGLPLYEGVD